MVASLKVLSGLLHPTAGSVTVDDFDPRRRHADFLKRITLVMGQKQQLMWDLPPAETYALNRALFEVPADRYEETIQELAELLDLANLATKPTRQLSLGERMKCELAAALLHRPTTLFLDEPTIGLDVSMQVAIRDFIRTYNQRYEATVLMTSHYMEDVVALCPRVIVIDRGKLIYDGDLRELAKKMHPDKLVSFTLTGPADREALERLGSIAVHEGSRVVLRVAHDRVHDVVSHVLADLPVADLGIADPPLEEVMRHLFKGESVAATDTTAAVEVREKAYP
jgi:ABC-2 type transport system ATP-binding protein